VVDSPREGEAGKLGWQSIRSCLGIIVRPGLVLIMVVVILFPHRGTTWHDAIVPIMAAVLARWWFANYPTQHDLVVAFIIVSYSPEDIVATITELVVALGSLVAFPSRGATCLDPGWPGRGPQWSGWSCEVKAGVVRLIL
jgi:hypothetical protein